MIETKITFQNNAEVTVQAQVFAGMALVSTGVAGPGETCSLTSEDQRYDIFFKNGTTGWEIGRRLGCEAKSFTLSKKKGRYVIT
jgi:hypothetical protein